MKGSLTRTRIGCALLLLILLTGFETTLQAQTTDQGITVYQYRHVPANKRDEFVKRETTYWAEVARKAMAKGNLLSWLLLEKVGGVDMEHKSNFLFVNRYKNIDAVNEVWSNPALLPAGISMDKMETGSMSTTTAMYFLHDQDWAQGASVNPEMDFKYVKMIYHVTNNASAVIAQEKKSWVPFIQSAMDKKQVSQAGWGNAILLSPAGGDVKFGTVSYDIFPTLKDALMPTSDPKLVYPQELFTELGKIETDRVQFIYQIVKVVMP